MQRFEFRLERVLRLKKQRLQAAEQRVRLARAALEAARAAVAALNDRLRQQAEGLEAAVGTVLSPGAWGTMQIQTEQLGRALEVAEARAATARRNVDEANRERIRMATEVEALLTLREQQWQQHRQLVQKAEQQGLDELGMRKWMGQQLAFPRPQQGERG